MAKGFRSRGHLTAHARQEMPKSDFARPGKGEGPKGAGSGSYPINDINHARNALARSSGKPEAAEVRAKVLAKYPQLKRNAQERRKAVYDHARSHKA